MKSMILSNTIVASLRFRVFFSSNCGKVSVAKASELLSVANKTQTSLKWNFTCQNCCKNDAKNGIHKTKISQNLIAFWLWIPFLQRLAAGGTARGGRSSRRDFRDGSETTLEPTFGGRGRHPRWNWDGSTNEQWEKTWECLGFIRDYTTGSYPVVWGI